ncbi:hypothetical protein [Veillonella agrestimuris]|uniref:hypothetical protein n=1 Tax=Veillonella agrestimuris TaxID=2941340 RepID=UPI00203C508D|nr:hypothetical protein [Veillonella agrestimuris]
MKRLQYRLMQSLLGGIVLAGTVGILSAYASDIPRAIPVEAGPIADVKVGSFGGRHDSSLITPNDWTYTALQTLIKHGAIRDTKGFVFDGTTVYTKDELMPLIDEVVDKREQMNDNDRAFALRIYQENMRDVMNYRVAKDRQEKLEKQRKQEEREAQKQKGKAKPSAARQEALDAAESSVNNGEEKALTEEEIKEKMKNFKIDDSRVRVNGDVRIRYGKAEGSKSGRDGRVRTEIAFTL